MLRPTLTGVNGREPGNGARGKGRRGEREPAEVSPLTRFTLSVEMTVFLDSIVIRSVYPLFPCTIRAWWARIQNSKFRIQNFDRPPAPLPSTRHGRAVDPNRARKRESEAKGNGVDVRHPQRQASPRRCVGQSLHEKPSRSPRPQV